MCVLCSYCSYIGLHMYMSFKVLQYYFIRRFNIMCLLSNIFENDYPFSDIFSLLFFETKDFEFIFSSTILVRIYILVCVYKATQLHNNVLKAG